jgi:cell wall-associated NlpC family hydrolase
MRFSQQAAQALTSLVGMKYARMNCWRVVQFAYNVQGVKLPDYWSALSLFRTLGPTEERQPFDVAVIRNHSIVTNHVGLYLGDGQILHSMEDTGVVCQPLSRIERVVGFLRLHT